MCGWGGGGSLVLCPCLWFGSSCFFQFSIPLAEEKKAVYFTFIVLTVSAMCLFLVVPWVGLRYVTMTFPGHTHLHFKIHLGSIRRRRSIITFHAWIQRVRLGVQTAPGKSQSYLFKLVHSPEKSQVWAIIGWPKKHYLKITFRSWAVDNPL